MERIVKKSVAVATALHGFSSNKVHDASGRIPSSVENLVVVGIKAGEILCVHPFHWNADLRKVERVSKTRHFFWYLNIGFSIAFIGLPLIQTIEEMVGWRFRTVEDAFILRVAVVNWMFPIALHATAFGYSDELPFYVNNGIRFFERFMETTSVDLLSGDNRASIVKFSEIFMVIIYYGFISLSAILILLSIWQPTLPIFPSSIVEDPTEARNWPIYGLSILAMSHETLMYGTMALLFIFAGVGILMPSLGGIDKLRSLDRLQVETKLQLYSQLLILGETFNRVYGSLLLQMSEIILVVLSIYGLVSVVTSEGLIRIAVAYIGVTAYGIFFALFRVFAEVSSKSEQLFAEWKLKNIMHTRVLRSLRPVRVRIRQYFFIDVGIILTVTDLIINNAAGILLAQQAD